MLIIQHNIENLEIFTTLKTNYEKYKKDNNDYYNYNLLIYLYQQELMKGKTEQILQQDYRIYCLEEKEKYYFDGLLLIDVSESEMKIILSLMEKQQNKNFKYNDEFKKTLNDLIGTHKHKKKLILNPQEVLLQGKNISFRSLPTEFLGAKNLLQQVGVWFNAEKENKNGTSDILILMGIHQKKPESYEGFLGQTSSILLKKFFLLVLQGKSNYIYTIEDKNPLIILDENLTNECFPKE